MTTARLFLKSIVLGVSLLASPILLTACSKPAEVPAAEETAPQDTSTSAQEATQARAGAEIVLPQLAYDYSFALSAPERALDSLMTGHRNACVAAGVKTCQVISLEAATDEARHRSVHTLTLRATPLWIESFRNDLTKQLEATGGRIEAQSIATEDLTHNIIDNQAHIRNKEALRDNLQNTLRTHKGKLSDVMDLQNKLSDVQSEIDSARSQLTHMQKRVAMSKVTLTYTGAAAAGTQGTLSPLMAAIGQIGPNFIYILTLLVMALSYTLPLAAVAAPIVWLMMRRKKKTPTA